jgi:uncharacterized protein YbbK (DUF523 family)
MRQKRLSRVLGNLNHTKSDERVLVSACLIGIRSRFDGTQMMRRGFIQRLKESLIVPVCPEQLGGLPTPRRRAEIIGGNGNDVLRCRARVIDEAGEDVTQQFLKGAREVLRVVRINKIKKAYLKENSPSCGTTHFNGKKKRQLGPGVTNALLTREGIEVIGVD